MELHQKYKDIKKIFESYKVIKEEAEKFPEDKTMQKLVKESVNKIEKLGKDIKDGIAKIEKSPQTTEFKETIKKIKELCKELFKNSKVSDLHEIHKIEEDSRRCEFTVRNLEIIQIKNTKTDFCMYVHLYSDYTLGKPENLVYYNGLNPIKEISETEEGFSKTIEGSPGSENFLKEIEKNLQDAGLRRGFEFKQGNTDEIKLRSEIKEFLINFEPKNVFESDKEIRTRNNQFIRGYRSDSDLYYRSGKEDDDHPDFIGGNKIMEEVLREMPKSLKEKTKIGVENQEKGWFNIIISTK